VRLSRDASDLSHPDAAIRSQRYRRRRRSDRPAGLSGRASQRDSAADSGRRGAREAACRPGVMFRIERLSPDEKERIIERDKNQYLQWLQRTGAG
jgi:hypothetical protein